MASSRRTPFAVCSQHSAMADLDRSRQLWTKMQQWGLRTYKSHQLPRPVKAFDLSRLPLQGPSSPMLKLLEGHAYGPCSYCQSAIDDLYLWTMYLRPLSRNAIGESCQRVITSKPHVGLPHHQLVEVFSIRYERLISLLRQSLCYTDVCQEAQFPCILILVYRLVMLTVQFVRDEHTLCMAHRGQNKDIALAEVHDHLKAAATILEMISASLAHSYNIVILDVFTRFHRMSKRYAGSAGSRGR